MEETLDAKRRIDAISAAVANAALEGIHVEPDEQELICRHQRGELTRAEFIEAARKLAGSKPDPRP